MNFDKILQKPFLISVFVFNIILFGVIVFLLGYVQNLLDSDSRNNLEEIVSQNKNVITSKLLLDLNRLDIISNKISDGLKNKNKSKAPIQLIRKGLRPLRISPKKQNSINF